MNEGSESHVGCIEKPPEDDPGPFMDKHLNVFEDNIANTTDKGIHKESEPVESTESWTEQVNDSLDNSSYSNSITSNDSKSALLEGQREKGKENDANSKQTILDIPYIQIVYEYNDFADLTNTNHCRSRANTMVGLLESPAYIDSVNCPTPDRRRIARACRNAVLTLSQEITPKKLLDTETAKKTNNTDAPEGRREEEDGGDFNSIDHHMKNLIFLGTAVFLMTTAIGSLKNLQSSLNHRDGVGMYSLAAGYVSYTVFSTFTPFIVQRFRPKKCLIIGLLPQLLYVMANLYPTFHILVPATFLQGIGNAILWNAISTYITYLARSYALKNDDRTVHIASKYFGILFFFYQFAMVVGNLISSLVLMQGRSGLVVTNNVTVMNHTSFNSTYNAIIATHPKPGEGGGNVCGSRYCHSDSQVLPNLTVPEETKYVLMGIFGLCIVFSIVVSLYLISPLKPYRTTYASCSLVCKQFTSVLRCAVDRRFLMLFLAFMYSSVQNGFVTGDVTKAFVTCPLGIHMVGYAMICFGVCGGVSSYLSGCLNKHVGHLALLTTAAILNLVLLLLMALWEPADGRSFLFLTLVGCWGLGDGIWISQVSSLISQIFPDCLEEAFAAQRMIQGLGGALWFGLSSSMCMMVKISLMVGMCLLSIALYIVQEILTKGRQPSKTVKTQTTA